MADLSLNFTIPDAYVNRFAAIIDDIWPGREEPQTKTQWAKENIIRELKTRVLLIEKAKQQSNITEITII